MMTAINEGVQTVQDAHLVILAEMDRICKKHQIQFFLESGTLLGAIRHKHAIPWDDDADTVMLRSEYERFKRIVRDELSEGFAFVEPGDFGEPAIFDFVPRVVMLNSQIHKDSEEEQYYGHGLNNHVGVDVFILDDVHDNNILHAICHGLLIFVYGLGMGHRYQLDMQDYQGASKLVVFALSKLGKLFKAKTILRWYDHLSQMGKGRNKKKHQCFYGNFLIQDIGLKYDKNWFAKETTVTLSGNRFPAPKEWDKVLRKLYGNYMELPPVEQRLNNHCQPEYVKVWNQKGQ